MKIQKMFFYLVLVAALPTLAFAHQPRIVESRQTVVTDPEISKAYYGQLQGVPDTYTIDADSPFDLYVNVLVPDIANQKKDVSATISKDGHPFAALDATGFGWKKMFEPFGYDSYWAGPEYKTKAERGTYVITVTSSTNDSKYSLAIGEIEKFDFKETMNSLKVIPQLKKSFFNESPINFIFSPFGWGLIVFLYVLAGIVGLIYRFAMKKFATQKAKSAQKNIGTSDRLLRFGIGTALLLLAITTNWSLILIFLSGFSMFEAIFSWCGLYAALGKNTCPVE